ncbi:MAG TPA: futalosine hydrolase [Planctomycetota bacterium]|nr:futalosine hydrolase [Planctomycetota bacterium]
MLLVCFATPAEGDRLVGGLGGGRGRVAGREVALLRTGIGPVNAAHAVTNFLARERVEAVISCGIGGAYPGALDLLDVACAETETYADLGADSPDGFLDMERLGFAVIEREPPLFNRLPLGVFPIPRKLGFATRTTCTGTDAAAREVAARTGAAVESMEGAAVVHVCLRMNVPVGEVRAVSNMVGNRDRGAWRVREAAAKAQGALLAWIEASPSPGPLPIP